MGKQSHERTLQDDEAKSVIRRLRISPQKLNLVASAIRGKSVSKALLDLSFMRRRIANDVKKVLQSAVANAETNHQLDVDRLVIKEAFVGKDMVMRRMRPRARGRSSRIIKPFSNMTIIVKETS